MSMLGIVGMRAGLHFGPGGAQARIAQAFQANFGSVVADDGVIAEHLKKFAAAFGSRSKFGFVGKFFEKSNLLRERTLHEGVLVFGFAAGVEPVEAAFESNLRGGSLTKAVFY